MRVLTTVRKDILSGVIIENSQPPVWYGSWYGKYLPTLPTPRFLSAISIPHLSPVYTFLDSRAIDCKAIFVGIFCYWAYLAVINHLI